MNHVSESLDWSYMSILGAMLGYVLHVLSSWREWRKLSKQPDLTLRGFILDDLPNQSIGLVCVVVVYLSLSALSQWDSAIKDMLGFTPRVDFFSAFMTAFASQGIVLKLLNAVKKISGP